MSRNIIGRPMIFVLICFFFAIQKVIYFVMKWTLSPNSRRARSQTKKKNNYTVSKCSYVFVKGEQLRPPAFVNFFCTFYRLRFSARTPSLLSLIILHLRKIYEAKKFTLAVQSSDWKTGQIPLSCYSSDVVRASLSKYAASCVI